MSERAGGVNRLDMSGRGTIEGERAMGTIGRLGPADALAEPFGGDMEGQEIVAAPIGRARRDLFADRLNIGMGADEPQALQHALDMGIDDEDRAPQRAAVERGGGDLARDAGQLFQPGERVFQRDFAEEVEMKVGQSRSIRCMAFARYSALASAKVTSAMARRIAAGAACANRIGVG